MSSQFDSEENSIAAAVSAGMAIGEPHVLVDDQLAIVLKPSGASVEQIDLQAFEDKYAANPRRKTGARSLATAASFIAYVNAHKLGSTAIYANKLNTKFAAVFNDHEPEPRERTEHDLGAFTKPERAEPMPQEVLDMQKVAAEASTPAMKVTLVRVEYDHLGMPGHGDFTATYNCPPSVEWQRWNRNSQHLADGATKKGMAQAEFMQFLEDNLLDIIRPSSGALLQAVHSFEAKKDVDFKSATRLQDGSITFNYNEQVNEVAQPGKLSLPEVFTILIPVFDGGAKYELDARLRYRITGGGLLLWYELVRPHKVLEHAFNTVLDEVTAGVVDVPVYAV